MNKQEAINKLKSKKSLENCLSNYGLGYNEALDEAIYIINQIDAQEKPVVPKYVADFYESIKDDFEDGVYDFFIEFYEYESRRNLSTDLYGWFELDASKPIETLVKMKLYGYDVEKEKLYRAKNRHTGEYLCYCFKFFHDKNSSRENQRFTAEEKRWEELGYWDNDLYAFEEVEGEDE